MISFEHFRLATSLIAEGKRDEAARHLDQAIVNLRQRRFLDEATILELRKLRESLAK